MDEAKQQQVNTLRQYVQALRALKRSVEGSIQQGTQDGISRLVVKQYHALHARIVETLPEDFTIASLALEIEGLTDERQIISQVQFAANQLLLYLEDQVREPRPVFGFSEKDAADFRNMGRDLQDQIANLTRTTLKRALSGIDIEVQADLTGKPREGLNLVGRDLRGGNFQGENLRDVNADNANLQNAMLSGANLRGARLHDVQFAEANLEGANLRDAKMGGASLVNALVDGADIRGVDLTMGNITDARMEGVNGQNANLSKVNGERVNLNGANLRDANLEGANLAGASMNGVNLRGANLTGTILTGARLNGATLPDGATYLTGMSLMRFGAIVE